MQQNDRYITFSIVPPPSALILKLEKKIFFGSTSCTSKLRLKVNWRIKFGLAQPAASSPAQSTIHFHLCSILILQLQFTCTWSGSICYPIVNHCVVLRKKNIRNTCKHSWLTPYLVEDRQFVTKTERNRRTGGNNNNNNIKKFTVNFSNVKKCTIYAKKSWFVLSFSVMKWITYGNQLVVVWPRTGYMSGLL